MSSAAATPMERLASERPAVGCDFGHKGGKGAGQHHALDADVDDARSLAEDAARARPAPAVLWRAM